ncbi:MAG: TlpA disulfide reductase family protein [Acidobacteriota bacterium]
MSRKLLMLTTASLLLLAATSQGQNRSLGILGQQAPAWELAEWYNLQPGVDGLDISDFEGKVIYLYFFQSWCPGCHSHGFPTLKKAERHFAGDDDVVFVAVQTVFEGFATNTARRGRDTLADFGLEIPLGQDTGDHGPSSLMRKYRTGGTPWTVLIDRGGVVRFNDFHIQPEQAIALIDRLRPSSGDGGSG